MQDLVETLTQNGWQTASQLKQLGFTDVDIAVALQDKLIQKQGQRRGTRYNVVGSEDFVKVTTFSQELRDNVLDFIIQNKVTSASEIVSHTSCDKNELRLILQSLIEDELITKSGAKKGTIYHVPGHVVEPKVKEVKVKEPKVPKQKSDVAPRRVRAQKTVTSEVTESEDLQSEELDLSL